jgi:hypothetical protein
MEEIIPEDVNKLIAFSLQPKHHYCKIYLQKYRCGMCGHLTYFQSMRCILCDSAEVEHL